MEKDNSGINQRSTPKSKSGKLFLILILLAGIGFAAWKYLLPILNGEKGSGKSTMKLPEAAYIKSTQQFGAIPVNQFGIVLKEGMTASDAKKLPARLMAL
ncbi:MAG: hypothetical protein IPM85_13765 [Chitinophagaceae bacterium]|nr:hypothetical protein [Chitinophagaceae bacterium]